MVLCRVRLNSVRRPSCEWNPRFPHMSTSPVEFPFVEHLPRAKRRDARTGLDWLGEIKDATRRSGALIPITLAGKILGVSQGRVRQLVEGGVLDQVVIDTLNFVTEESVIRRAYAPRLTGRPKKGSEVKS